MDLASGDWQVSMSADVKHKAAFVTHERTFERLMDRVLCGMRWSRCLVYLDDVISFGATVSEALLRLEEVLDRLSNSGLQPKAKKIYIYADGGGVSGPYCWQGWPDL